MAALNYLELTQAALFEAGISQTTAQPQSLDNLSGMALKFKRWTAQAWNDIRNLDSFQSELDRTWFQTTVNPRFYFDIDATGYEQVFPGDVLEGVDSGAQFTITNVIIVNNGLWADATAQGLIEFTDLTGSPQPSELLKIVSTDNTSCRFLNWGDYKLDSQTEMGAGYVSNLETIWWESLRLSNVASETPPGITQRRLPYMAYSQFLQNYDVNVMILGTPYLVTETPDDGNRIMFFPPPDRPYRLGGYYYTTDTGLVNDTDYPTGLKSVFHPMIVWRTVMYYGQYEQQPGIYAEAKDRFDNFAKRLKLENDTPAVFVSKRLY